MLADVYTPRVSGVTQHIRATKRELEARGHKVFVFTFGNLDHEDDEPGISRSPGLPLAGSGYFLGLRYAREAQRRLESVAVAHVHHPFLSGQLAMRYARPQGIPVVFTNHTRYDLYAESYLPLIPRQIRASLLRSYLCSFCDEVDSVIAPSDGLKSALRDFGVHAPVEVIPNGVDLGRFRGSPTPRSPTSLGFGKHDLVLVYAGRLAPEKNLIFLLRAFSGALAACGKARLMLVGDGPDAENLRHYARKEGLAGKVRFVGMVPHGEMPHYLAGAQAFVTASVTDVLPLSVIEALAVGLPVIGIASPGVGDLVADGQNGLLSPNDLDDFTERLTRFLTDGRLRVRLRRGTRPSVQDFDIQRTSALLEEHYLHVLARSSTRGAGAMRTNEESIGGRLP